MSYSISPGVYPRETDQSVVVPAVANSIGGIVITADRGPADEITLVTSNKEFVDTFGKPSPTNPSMYTALAFLEKANRLLVVRVTNGASTATVQIVDGQTTPLKVFTVNSASPGVWGNTLSVDFGDVDPVSGMFDVTVKQTGKVVESFSVTRDSTKLDGYGKSQYIEDVINKRSQFINVTDDISNIESHTVISGAALSGGINDTGAPVSGDINVAWERFSVKEDVEVNLLLNGGFTSPEVQNMMTSLAESRGDCMAILDIPSAESSVQNMVDYVNDADGDGTGITIDSSFAAIYAPWVKIYDNFNDKELFVPPSGYVGGVYASTAESTEVWFAPAGQRRGTLNVLGVARVFSEGDRDFLYSNNINPIQKFANAGIQVYGQKTLQRTPSATDRVNVRMLMITIEKAIARSLRPFVFEFNDRFTRENVQSIIGNYMEDIKTRRGVYDYLVVCDPSNNTAQVIDGNQMVVDLYVKPTRVAEFIQLNAVITNTGTAFQVQ